MNVTGGGINVGVAEEGLHDSQINAGLGQSRPERVPQRMRVACGNIGLFPATSRSSSAVCRERSIPLWRRANQLPERVQASLKPRRREDRVRPARPKKARPEKGSTGSTRAKPATI